MVDLLMHRSLVLGHADMRTSMLYQHPVVDSIREVIDQRNSRRN